jgi:hypothetical protein
MNVPPPEIASWVSLAKDSVTITAAGVGAFVAVRGLSAWRKQLRGKTDYELARRLLKASYKVRDAIRIVRHPAIWSGEAAAAQKEVVVDDDDLKGNPNAGRAYAVYHVRWKKVSEAMVELEAEAFEAEVSWGESAKEKIAGLRKHVGTLRFAVEQHIEGMADRSSSNRPKLPDYGDILYDKLDPDNPDDFARSLNDAIGLIEAYLRPHLGSK